MNGSVGRGNINQRILSFMRTDSVDSPAHARQQISKRQKIEAINGERQSLIRLVDLLRRSMEVLELWKILADHQFGVLVAQLPPYILEYLRDATLRKLVATKKGEELCSDLITCLIQYHLSDDATTDEISARLRRVCPGLYTTDDATEAKASELLQTARTLEDGPRKDETLEQALRLFRKVIHQLQLPTICAQLQEALCFDGIVELSLQAAEALDPQNLGLAHYKNGNVQEGSPQIRQAYANRIRCYQCITDQLERLQAGSQDIRINSQMAQIFCEDMMKTVLDSNDELAHVALYDWMLEKNMADKLLHVSSPFLECYLQSRAAEGGPLTERLLDLLWQFYEKQSRYLSAARLLLSLAEQEYCQLDLNKRLTYLSRAVMCAKAAPDIKTDRGAFLQELEDKLEKYLTNVCYDWSLSSLFDVTQLYNEYAEEFNLPECKLAIVHCAGHCDQQLMETLWREIIEKELALSQHDSSDSRMKRLETKLVALSKLYAVTPRYFPSEFIIEVLETKFLENGFQPECLIRVGEGVGFEPLVFLSVLNGLYGQRQSVWRTNPKAQTHLLYGILNLVERFEQKPEICSADARRKFLSECQDAVSKYQVELEGNPSRDMQTLRQSFHALELKLSRKRF